MENIIKIDGANYVMEWYGGHMRSGTTLTLKQVARALTNWYKKDEEWTYITVRNVKTGKSEVFWQENKHDFVTQDMIYV